MCKGCVHVSVCGYISGCVYVSVCGYVSGCGYVSVSHRPNVRLAESISAAMGWYKIASDPATCWRSQNKCICKLQKFPELPGKIQWHCLKWWNVCCDEIMIFMWNVSSTGTTTSTWKCIQIDNMCDQSEGHIGKLTPLYRCLNSSVLILLFLSFYPPPPHPFFLSFLLLQRPKCGKRERETKQKQPSCGLPWRKERREYQVSSPKHLFSFHSSNKWGQNFIITECHRVLAFQIAQWMFCTAS